MKLHHRFDGAADAPVLVLPSSLGTTTELWGGNAEQWARAFRVLRYDQRGHGGSDVPPGPYSIDDLGRDVLTLLDELELARMSFCGLSLGGATAMWVAAHAPERIESLVLACTSARFGEPGQWFERAASARSGGVEAIADAVIGRWFTPRFAEEQRDVVSGFRNLLAATPPEGYAGCCEALAAWDFRERLREIQARTLVLAGADDMVTPVDHSRLLAERIPRAKLVVLEGAAHLANVEQAEPFSRAVAEHLTAPLLEVA